MQTYSTRNAIHKSARSAFGLGIAEGTRIAKTWTEGSLLCELVEDDLWYEREDGTGRYWLHMIAPGYVGAENFASWGDALAYAWMIARGLAEEQAAAERARAPKRRPARRRTVEPTPSDREWWAQNDLEASLGRLAPVAGGSPEPELGVSGAWHLPDEDGLPDLYPAEIDHDADGRRGAWGGYSDEG